MTLEAFKKIYGKKSAIEKLDLLNQQYDYWGEDLADKRDAINRHNQEEATYWHNEAIHMRARIEWLTEEIKKELGKIKS